MNDVRRSVREGSSVQIDDVAPLFTVEANAMDVLQLRDLEAALGMLAPEQRQVILLVGLEGMSYEEVAAILGIPIGTVRSRLSRGRDQLRKLMGMDAEPAPAAAAAVDRDAAGKGATTTSRRQAA